MQRIFGLLMCVQILFSCERHRANRANHANQLNTASLQATPNEVAVPLYTIENKEFYPQFSKTSIDIRLQKRITESEIEAIAYKIKQDFPSFNKHLFSIGYREWN